MEAERLEVFRKLLQNRLDALLRGNGDAIGSLTDERESLSDAVDLATEESEREFTLRMAEHDRVIVKEIREALVRVVDGDYGNCIACGEEIGERRLMARPMATHCIDCKTEVEIKERSSQRFSS